MSFSAKIKRQNKQKFDRRIIEIEKNVQKKRHVQVGLFGGDGSYESEDGSSVTVAEVGFYNEFGTNKNPERPFMRRTVIEQKKEIKRLSRVLAKKVEQGHMTIDIGLGSLGEKVSGFIKKTIIAVDSPIESPMTLAKKKGVSNPLIDSSQMLNSVTHQVKNGKL